MFGSDVQWTTELEPNVPNPFLGGTNVTGKTVVMFTQISDQVIQLFQQSTLSVHTVAAVASKFYHVQSLRSPVRPLLSKTKLSFMYSYLVRVSEGQSDRCRARRSRATYI